MGEIVTDLTDVDMSKFDSKYDNGEKIYKFDFKLEVVLGHKQGTLSFRIRAGGEVVGQTSVDFSR